MPEEISNTVAESSPAEPESSDVPSIPTDPHDYAEWRQTGKLPAKGKPTKQEASAPSKSADDESGKTAPVSETGNHKQERPNAETRVKELLADRATDRAEKAALRAELEELKAGKKGATAEASAAPAKHEKAESSPASDALQQRPAKPKQDDYDSWSAYDSAMDKYYEDLADFKAGERIEKQEQKARQDALTKEMDTRLSEAKTRYGEEAEPKIIESAKTIFDDQKVAPAIKAALGRSQVLVDALYVMGSDQAAFSEFVDLARQDPLEALRKWFTVEGLVKEELAKGKAQAEPGATPPRGSDGKFLPDRPKRSAPPPPVELNGNTASTGDSTDRAANSGDFRSFKTERDRKDLLRHRGQV
jgi:hypothetical protein